MWLEMAAPLLLCGAPNMSSSTLLENGGRAQKRKQQSKLHDTSVSLPRDFSPYVVFIYPATAQTFFVSFK